MPSETGPVVKRRRVTAAAAPEAGVPESNDGKWTIVQMEELVNVTLTTSRPGRRIRRIKEFTATIPLPLVLFAFVRKNKDSGAAPIAWTHKQVEAALMSAYPGCISEGHTIHCTSGHFDRGTGPDDPVYVKRESGLTPCIVVRVVPLPHPPSPSGKRKRDGTTGQSFIK